jgi:high-affinity K+ transport system ATPase subunit B
MTGRSHVTLASMLMRGLRELHPGQANRRPALFILEVSAALLSVLALRDGMSGNSAASLETLFAIGLWATLLAIACGLTIRGG